MKSNIDRSPLPKISVVTVSYNAVSTIEETILSVINQNYENIEYIIIDGGSTDGTVDIVKKYITKISYWVSEPDKGIYDAMNKGIKVATGEWINFMNSGDVFSSDRVVDKVAVLANSNIDVIYGDVILKYSWGCITKKAKSISCMKSHLPFAHQSCFIAIGIMKQLLYDTSFKICADYHFFYKLYFVKKAKFKYLDDIISIYEAEQGLSAVNYLNLKKEIGKIHGKNNDFYWRIYIRVLNYYLKITSVVKSYMPRKCLVCYHKLRYR